jgi:ABC-type branched-subunit amino acid transport system substrate-binding protein
VKRAVSTGLTAVLIAVSLVIGAAAGFFAYPAVVPPSEKIVEKVVEKPVEKIVEVVKQPPPAPEAIKIGYSISLTGSYAATAKRQHEGVLLWADWVNRQGGIFVKEYNSRIPVKLVWYDDESNTDRAIALYERLITVDKVDFLLGPYGSPLTAAVAPIAEKYKKLLISSLGSDDYIFEQGYKYIVQPLTPASFYFHSTLDMVKALDPAAKKVAIIYRDVAKEYNSRIPVKLVWYDDESNTDRAIALYERLITLDNDKVRQVFNELSFTTAYGAFKIDPATGKQIAHKMVLVQWQGGKKVIVWPPEGATAKPIYPIPPWDKKG